MSGNVKFRWFLLTLIVLSFLTACTTTGKLNNTSSPLEVNTSDVATGTGFLFSSSDYVITSYHVVHGAKSIQVRLINGVWHSKSVCGSVANTKSKDIFILVLYV